MSTISLISSNFYTRANPFPIKFPNPTLTLVQNYPQNRRFVLLRGHHPTYAPGKSPPEVPTVPPPQQTPPEVAPTPRVPEFPEKPVAPPPGPEFPEPPIPEAPPQPDVFPPDPKPPAPSRPDIPPPIVGSNGFLL